MESGWAIRNRQIRYFILGEGAVTVKVSRFWSG